MTGLSLIRPQCSLLDSLENPLGLDEYQEFTSKTDRTEQAGLDGFGFALLGLFGEIGSLLSALKKKQRDKDAYVAYREAVIEELGDALWYFANAADRAGIALSLVAQRATSDLKNWSYSGTVGPTTFIALQKPKQQLGGPVIGIEFERSLVVLAGRIGQLLQDFGEGRIHANGDVLSADLIETFRGLIVAADQAEVSLDEAAERNIEKALSRWPLRRVWGRDFDAGYSELERLPRRLVMTFSERDVLGRQYVIQQCNGINIGDRLTDNRAEPDDYRFHDVFHLAYYAILGWSPVVRALLKLKRKSNPVVDETQDGARAILIEEGIATWVFNHGTRQNDFRSAKALDYGVLKLIRELIQGFEVQERPLWQWEHAILEGFRVFRELRKCRGGVVTADLDAHALTFSPAVES